MASRFSLLGVSRSFASGRCPRLAPVRAGGLRQAARGLLLAPVRAGGLRELQWETVELGRGAFGGGAHPGRVERGGWFSPRNRAGQKPPAGPSAGPGRAATGTPCNSRKAVVSVPCMNAPANLIEHSLLVIRQVSLQATSAQSSTGTAMRRLAPLMRMPLRPVVSARAGRRMFLDPFRVVAARRRVGSSKAPMRWRLGRRAAHRLPFFSVPATLGALGVELFHEATPFIRQRVRSICRSRR